MCNKALKADPGLKVYIVLIRGEELEMVSISLTGGIGEVLREHCTDSLPAKL